MRTLRLAILAVSVLLVAAGASASNLVVLTAGKVAKFQDREGTARDMGLVRFQGDPRLPQPSSPGGAVVTVQVASYPQSTNLMVYGPVIELPPDVWRRKGKNWIYADKDGTRGGLRKMILGAKTLLIKWKGEGFTPPPGPAGYVEVWIEIEGKRHLGRFHDFKKNDATALVTRKPSKAAADGERAFWDVLHRDDDSEARQQEALAQLAKAVKQRKKDGRSHFLAGMMRLYRYGRIAPDFRDISDEARAEAEAALAAFRAALPLLWDGTTGDTRVPGFVGAAAYQAGVALGDAALKAEGLAILGEAFALNPLFNVFDYIPVAMVETRDDPAFQIVIDALDEVLGGPGIVCVIDQPEICADAGLAPSNTAGSLILFGDLYAKAGRLADATTWYTLGANLATARPTPYRFQAVADERVATAAERVALYDDADPLNDPLLFGAGEQNCAACHNR